MVDNSVSRSAPPGVFSSSLRTPAPAHGAPPGPGPGSGGTRLEAVMENLQRQQEARLRQRAAEKELQHQALLRHYQAAVHFAPGLGLGLRDRAGSEEREDTEEDEPNPPAQRDSPQNHSHEWTYEEQFKQLYELDSDEKRKEFLDDLFGFMQKRGTPVNRIPIMAKQVLDLYMLYKLVTEKGGLVEVINKKIWREITKGLNLPTSITSAAFTLRTQYMKYLYPYECEKRSLSSPAELQAAIDSNRREGRRQSYGTAIFNYSPVSTPTLLAPPKAHLSHLSHLHLGTHPSGALGPMPGVKKEEPLLSHSHHMGAVQAAALDQLRDRLDSEPPEKKMMMEEHRLMQQALQRNLLAMATQLPLSISLSNRDDRQAGALNLSTHGISSINMSIEINGLVYTGK
uniref:AT-rich interactive domain-containing protein 3 n=1 Tax=Neogobius melanostomus TaxID=47308 RepID=A0A8C6UG45_9GOBI